MCAVETVARSLVIGVFKDRPFALQYPLRRRPAHRLVRFVHPCQELNVGLREPAGKPIAPVNRLLHLAVFQVPADQSRHLR